MTLGEFILQNLVYILPLLAALLAFVFGRILKLSISASQILQILSAIVRAIWHVEVMSNDAKNVYTGPQKLDLAKAVVVNNMNQKHIKKTLKLFGSITGAVQAVFNIVKPILDANKK